MRKKIQNLEEYTQKTHKGAELFNEKKYDQALDIFIELSEYNKENFKVFETLSMIYLKLNRLQEADKAYKTAVDLFSRKSGNEVKLKSFDEAVSELESIDKLEEEYDGISASPLDPKEKPDIHKLPIKIGLHYMARGDYKQAEELLISHREKYFKKNN